MTLVTRGAIDVIREQFTKDIEEQISMRKHSTRPDKE